MAKAFYNHLYYLAPSCNPTDGSVLSCRVWARIQGWRSLPMGCSVLSSRMRIRLPCSKLLSCSLTSAGEHENWCKLLASSIPRWETALLFHCLPISSICCLFLWRWKVTEFQVGDTGILRICASLCYHFSSTITRSFLYKTCSEPPTHPGILRKLRNLPELQLPQIEILS